MNNKHQNKNHQAVLAEAVLSYLDPKPGESLLDLTAGYGGHAQAILKRTLKPKLATLIDRDQSAIKYLEELFSGQGVNLINQDFLKATKALLDKNQSFDLILADLGVSSPQLDDPNRGFSIRLDGPIDMRMDQKQVLIASQIVNDYSESDIAKIIKKYGEEPKARQIAKKIVASRPILSTGQLASVIATARGGHSKHHPATKTFQGLRIAVNQEIDQLSDALPIWVNLLKPGGRIVVISFHSLEDRLVKNVFRDLSSSGYETVLKVLTKHPIAASYQEIVSNPRARSAKLRAAVKINTERGSRLNHADSS
jgi:16S rRNA (cytosine1402-N4)-methyltransferase